MDKETDQSKVVAEAIPSAPAIKKESKPVAVKEVEHRTVNAFDKINFFDEKELVKFKSFIAEYIKTDKNGGIKNANDALAIAIRAKELGLPFTACAEHVHVINGKTGVDIHIIKGLLSRAGCTWKCTKDYQPLYEYTDGINQFVDGELPDYCIKCQSSKEAETKKQSDVNGDYMYVYPVRWFADAQGNKYPEYRINQSFAIVSNQSEMKAAMDKKLIAIWRVPNIPVNYITEYEITRNINGKEMISKGKFTLKEAMAAGFFEKDTYKKYARIMIGNRAFTYAARDIGSDLLFGCMETTEIKIATNSNLNDKDFAECVEVIE